MIFLEKYCWRTVLMIFMITSFPEKSYSENAIRGVPNTFNTQYTEASENRYLSKKLDMMRLRLSFEKASEMKSEDNQKLLNDLDVVFNDMKEVIDNPAAGSKEKILEDDTAETCSALEGCPCRSFDQCNSGRCEDQGISSGTCQARVDNGESCNENTDCKSHNCNWWGECEELERIKEGSWCRESYTCEDGFHCDWMTCTSNKELVEATTGKTCNGESNTNNKIKVMSYNVFLLHDWGFSGNAIGLLARDEEKRRVAVNDISNWLKETKTDVDVILVQEQFDLTEEFKAGMIEAGYCNSVTDERDERTKSGLAIFSKHPIVDYEFWNWCDRSSWTPMCGGGGEVVADKGILYAKININGNIVHVTNTHTTSDSLGDAHSVRMLQFEYHVQIMSKKNPNNDGLALMAGDFNENYYDHHQYDKDTDSYKDTSASAYYTEMLPALNAKEISLVGDGLYTYDSVTNTVLHEVYEDREHDGEYRERLDYIFPVDGTISDANLASSTCQILNTVTYSDHYPLECTITIA